MLHIKILQGINIKNLALENIKPENKQHKQVSRSKHIRTTTIPFSSKILILHNFKGKDVTYKVEKQTVIKTIIDKVNNQTFIRKVGIERERHSEREDKGFVYRYQGEYCLLPKIGLPNKTVWKSIKRDIIALRNARVANITVKVTYDVGGITKTEICNLSSLNVENTFNTIRTLIISNFKLKNNEKFNNFD